MAKIEKITPNLWFDTEAEDAARYYTSIFKNSYVETITRYTAAGQETHKMKPGSVMTVVFSLDGTRFIGLNGGPIFKFNESVSFVVNCENQEEVDYFWEKLSAGGDPKSQQCGWLKDKFGLSWQIVPEILPQLLASVNESKAERVMAVMMKMKKLNVAELEAAAND